MRALLADARRRLHRARFFRGRAAPNSSWGVFRTFEEAQAAVPRRRPVGYDLEVFGGYYREALERPRASDYPVLRWLGPLAPAVRRIFDLGGHVGVTAYALAPHLGDHPGLRWEVCDVPAVVRAGEALARERGRGDLRFTTRFEDADGADVLMSSGALQYLEPGFLTARLGALRRPPAHLFVNRTPFHPTRAFVTLQFTGPSFHPYAVARRDAFVASVERCGYRLVDAWDCERTLEVPFHPGHAATYQGLYFRREDEARVPDR